VLGVVSFSLVLPPNVVVNKCIIYTIRLLVISPLGSVGRASRTVAPTLSAVMEGVRLIGGA